MSPLQTAGSFFEHGAGLGPAYPYYSYATIFATTRSPEKLSAISSAIESCFLEVYGDHINFAAEGVDVPSGVAAQPVGDGIRIGAENRFANLERAVKPQLENARSRHIYLVAVQKGIVQERTDGDPVSEGLQECATRWVDRYFVIVKNVNTGCVGKMLSEGAHVTRDCVEAAIRSTSEDYSHKN